MRALGRVSENAARVAQAASSRHLQIVPGSAETSDFVDESQNVVSLASARARRAGHPAGSARDR